MLNYAFECCEGAAEVWGQSELVKMSCKAWWDCRVFCCMPRVENFRTHLLLVGLRPFQRRSLVSYVFEVVGTQEEADGTTTGGERPWVALEIGDADFFRWCWCRRIGEAAIDGSTKAAHLLMPLHLGRRSMKLEGIWLGVHIDLQMIGEVTVYFAAFKNTKTQ